MKAFQKLYLAETKDGQSLFSSTKSQKVDLSQTQ